MNLLSFFRKSKTVRCYPYCLGLKYDREIGITQEQWEKCDVNLIAELMLKDLQKLKISSKIVDETYIPSTKENLIILKAGFMWQLGDSSYCDYHVIVKRQDGYWYTKFGRLAPERLPLDMDIQSWNWRDSNKRVEENHYNSKIVYLAVQC